VVDSGFGKQDAQGCFEFDLEDLPYEVGLKLYRYIQDQAKPELKRENQRQKTRERALLKRQEQVSQ
jgi:hypothetical protein